MVGKIYTGILFVPADHMALAGEDLPDCFIFTADDDENTAGKACLTRLPEVVEHIDHSGLFQDAPVLSWDENISQLTDSGNRIMHMGTCGSHAGYIGDQIHFAQIRRDDGPVFGSYGRSLP